MRSPRLSRASGFPLDAAGPQALRGYVPHQIAATSRTVTTALRNATGWLASLGSRNALPATAAACRPSPASARSRPTAGPPPIPHASPSRPERVRLPHNFSIRLRRKTFRRIRAVLCGRCDMTAWKTAGSGSTIGRTQLRGFCSAIVLAAACLALPVAASARADEGPTAGRPLLAPLAVPKELRVVSYFPADAGWTRMWEPWRPARLAVGPAPPAVTEREHRPSRRLAAVLRLPRARAEVPRPPSELVSIAATEGLHVQLTLFDWWGEYRDVVGSKRWASTLLAPYVGDPRVAFVELRNEIDPSDADAVAWARELVPWLRTLLGRRTPVTLSVACHRPGSGPARARGRAAEGLASRLLRRALLHGRRRARARTSSSGCARRRAPTPVWVGSSATRRRPQSRDSTAWR